MIQPNELRIGNYVNYPFGGMQKIRNGEDIDNIYEAAGDPIPLTPELLEKCGFGGFNNKELFVKKYKAQGELMLFSSNMPIAKANEFPPGKFYFMFNGTAHIINYLHQLQNLYYFLTGEELEIKL